LGAPCCVYVLIGPGQVTGLGEVREEKDNEISLRIVRKTETIWRKLGKGTEVHLVSTSIKNLQPRISKVS